MLVIIVLLIIVLLTGSCSDKIIWDNTKKLRTFYELGYFEGQKNALQNKYCVSFDDDNEVYYWSKNLYTAYATEEELAKYKGFDVTVTYNPSVDSEKKE